MNVRHNKEEVIKKGKELFCRKGYNSLGVDEICKTTGMTKGAFYHNFISKENFLIETLKTYGNENVARIERELMPNDKQSAIQRLQQFYTNMLEAQPKANFIGCMINSMMSELGGKNPLVGKITAMEFEKFISAIEPTIKLAQQEGDINPELDSKKVTDLLHSTFYGCLTITKSFNNPSQAIETMNLLINNLKNK